MTSAEKQALIHYRITRAKETLREVDILVENKLWNTAVNRMYYSCYYAVIALLVDHDIQTQTHSGVRQMFGLHFIKPGLFSKELGKFYSDIFDMRQSGDYADYIDFTDSDVIDLIQPSRELIISIERYLSSHRG